MASMVGTLSHTDGQSVTLTSGLLPLWVSASGTNANTDITQVYGYGAEGSGNDWTSYFHAGTTLLSITDQQHFKITPAVTGLGADITGIKIIVSQQWLAATQQWWQNVNYTPSSPPHQPGASPVSLGAGYLGSDGEVSVDLRPAGANAVLWFNGDTSWATGVSQHQNGAGTPGATFIHQTMSIQTGGSTPHLDTDTMTFYTGNSVGGSSTTNPQRLIPAAAPSTWAWLVTQPVCVNQYVLLVAGYPISLSGFNTIGYPAVWWVNNPVTSGSATLPWNWTYQRLPIPGGVGWLGGMPVYDLGDG